MLTDLSPPDRLKLLIAAALAAVLVLALGGLAWGLADARRQVGTLAEEVEGLRGRLRDAEAAQEASSARAAREIAELQRRLEALARSAAPQPAPPTATPPPPAPLPRQPAQRPPAR
jgi:uncharacterized protein HemX